MAGKKFKAAVAQVDLAKLHSLSDALELVVEWDDVLRFHENGLFGSTGRMDDAWEFVAHSALDWNDPATLTIGDKLVLQHVVVGVRFYDGVEGRLNFIYLRLFFAVQVVKFFTRIKAYFGLRCDQLIDRRKWSFGLH